MRRDLSGGGAAAEMVQFHQSYTYEDFVQGLRPTKDGHFAVKDGCFYRLCRNAFANGSKAPARVDR